MVYNLYKRTVNVVPDYIIFISSMCIVMYNIHQDTYTNTSEDKRSFHPNLFVSFLVFHSYATLLSIYLHFFILRRENLV